MFTEAELCWTHCPGFDRPAKIDKPKTAKMLFFLTSYQPSMNNIENDTSTKGPSKRRKLLVYGLVAIIGLAVLIAILPGEKAPASATPVLNVTLDGWTFAANIGDEWREDSHLSTVIKPFYNEVDHEGIAWSGTSANLVFFVPKTETEKRYSGAGGKSGRISIEVLQVPPEMRNYSVLTAALYNIEWNSIGEGHEEDLFFGGREAHLWELPQTLDGVKYDESMLAVQLSDTKIATIDVNRWDGSEKSATDVINSFTISPVS
jgi:hypothetical protein